jgi:hypothetical protein
MSFNIFERYCWLVSVFCFSNIIRRSCIDAQSTKTSVDQDDGDDDSLHDPDFVAENEVADSEDSGTIEFEQDAAWPLCDISNDQSSPEKSQRSRKRARSDGEKHERNLDKYQLKPPCSCKMKCFEKILEDRRVAVHEQFWSMTYNNRRSFIHSHILIWLFNRKADLDRALVKASEISVAITCCPMLMAMVFSSASCSFWEHLATRRIK